MSGLGGRASRLLWALLLCGLAGGCSSSSYEGNLVEISVEAGAGEFSDGNGQWVVEEILLAPTAVEILPCEADAAAVRIAVQRPKHVESTPFQSGVSMVWPVVGGTAESYYAGDIEPPADEYCAVRILIAPLDQDSIRGEEYPGLEDHTLSVRASVVSSPEGDARVVDTQSTLRVEGEIMLSDAPVLIDGPAKLTLSIDVGVAFSGIEADSADADIARAILAGVPNAISAQVSAL